MASDPANTDSIRRSADSQLSSPFFTLLPAEIRNLIYAEFLHLCSPRQHIVLDQISDEHNPAGLTEKWAHRPCITDPTARDTRFDKFLVTDPVSNARVLWGNRLKSEWCLHWACEEQGADSVELAHPVAELSVQQFHRARENDTEAEEHPSPPPAKTGLLDILTACKRM
jgi:hypothetical protein